MSLPVPAAYARRVLLVDAGFELLLGLALVGGRPWALPAPLGEAQQVAAGAALLPVAAVLASRGAVGEVGAAELRLLAVANGATAALLGGWLLSRFGSFSKSTAVATGGVAVALAGLAAVQAQIGRATSAATGRAK